MASSPQVEQETFKKPMVSFDFSFMKNHPEISGGTYSGSTEQKKHYIDENAKCDGRKTAIARKKYLQLS